MFEKNIIFLAPDIIVEDKNLHPETANKFIPEWFKELPVSVDYLGREKGYLSLTIKACMPFLDAIKTGYILKSPVDIYFNHNFKNKDLTTDTQVLTRMADMAPHIDARRVNLNTVGPWHEPWQLGNEKCPYLAENKNKSFYKIKNPWVIKTPPGYSCLFIPQLNNPDKRFTPIAGIVDTDDFNIEVNFPIIMHQEGEWILKKYSPIIAVFPFKRDNWKKIVKKINSKEEFKNKFKFFSYFKNFYKDYVWKSKKWN